jgi:hypothetical protein
MACMVTSGYYLVWFLEEKFVRPLGIDYFHVCNVQSTHLALFFILVQKPRLGPVQAHRRIENLSSGLSNVSVMIVVQSDWSHTNA